MRQIIVCSILATLACSLAYLQSGRRSANWRGVRSAALRSISSDALRAETVLGSGDRKAMMDEILEMMKGAVAQDEDDEDSRSQMCDGVVRIYCTHAPPNPAIPWQRMKQEFSTSTGFIIDGNRILTNAHAVEYGSLIQVKKRQSEDKYVATVTAIGHECDLAILSVVDPTFFDNISPLEFGNIPDLMEDVSVVGYPVGGDSLSIANGVVSRIEMQEYAQASAQLLAIQIDAAINPGNSGGPVVNTEGQVIGVAFQSLAEEDIENIGYVVPVNVINHFLDDVSKHGSYSGVSGLGVRLQDMENEMLRKHYGMAKTDTGVLVVSTAPLAPSNSILKKGDVIMKLDDVRVANDGTIAFRDGTFKERVAISYYFTQKFAGDSIAIEILRDGKTQTVDVPLWISDRLVPRMLTKKIYDKDGKSSLEKGIIGGSSSYLMIGGLVFIALTQEYLEVEFNTEHMTEFERWGDEFKLLSLVDKPLSELGEEVVLLSQVISNKCNIGCETLRNLHLKKMNGEEVKSLKHLKNILDSSNSLENGNEKDLVFEFSSGQMLVLDEKMAFEAQSAIKEEHFVPKSCSDDLL